MTRRALFLYLTKHSGHYSAAMAIESAMRRLDTRVETMMLDSFSHANPVLSRVTLRAYLAALKTAPEIWEWMYDNPGFKERTAKIRELLAVREPFYKQADVLMNTEIRTVREMAQQVTHQYRMAVAG